MHGMTATTGGTIFQSEFEEPPPDSSPIAYTIQASTHTCIAHTHTQSHTPVKTLSVIYSLMHEAHTNTHSCSGMCSSVSARVYVSMRYLWVQFHLWSASEESCWSPHHCSYSTCILYGFGDDEAIVATKAVLVVVAYVLLYTLFPCACMHGWRRCLRKLALHGHKW